MPFCRSLECHLWPWKTAFPGTGVLGEACHHHSLWSPGLTFLAWNKGFLTFHADQDCHSWNFSPQLSDSCSIWAFRDASNVWYGNRGIGLLEAEAT